eukprot:CAMPEP_0168705060 /NCGR_PEP_ID=MMETSP0503-20121227/39892_1 /TAXON_ID=89963 /ORGANISM="Heterocapsa rotundata, Strain SCCAP K-0483" /LENGTH=60 /DNA_ID=CAMNT_0008751279 /DNA_START=27 /DNA_END=205 /DNA_ORIENTATION=+
MGFSNEVNTLIGELENGTKADEPDDDALQQALSVLVEYEEPNCAARRGLTDTCLESVLAG